jgi:transcriptional regulator with XRE-family HTH domain
MSGVNLAYVNPKILRWARRRIRLSLDRAATAAKVSPESLRVWERGKGHPTFAAARRIADAFRIPLGYLWLTEPPGDTKHLRSTCAHLPSASWQRVRSATT